MNDEVNKPPGHKKSLDLALILAFAPWPVFLAIITYTRGLSDSMTRPLLWLGCLAGIACGFASSSIMFSRRTWLARAAGSLFLVFDILVGIFCGYLAWFRT